jgi:hypothetical protein
MKGKRCVEFMSQNEWLVLLPMSSIWNRGQFSSIALRLVPVDGATAHPGGRRANLSGGTVWWRWCGGPRWAVGIAPVRTGRYRSRWSWAGRYHPHYRLPLGLMGGSDTTPPNWSVWIYIWSFEYEFDRLNWKLAVFIVRDPKNPIF